LRALIFVWFGILTLALAKR